MSTADTAAATDTYTAKPTMTRLVLAIASALLLGQLAAQELRLLLPTGASRGQRVKVTCYGRNLKDTVGVVWMREGITVHKLEAKRDDRIVMTLDVPEDCELGAHLFALHTKRGMTRPKAFRVGSLPSIRERKTPHGTPSRAQRIALNLTVDGRILAEETDCYAFECQQAQAVRIDVEAIRLGLTDLDLQLEVFDPNGKRIVRIDDTSLGRADPGTCFVAPSSGTYTLSLADIAHRGSSAGAYRLHVGTYPRPVGLLPAGGRPGQRIETTLLGQGEYRTTTVQLPDRVGMHEVFPIVAGRASATPVWVSVDERANFVEGASPKKAPTAPCAFHGVIAKTGEEDGFEFRAKKGKRIPIRVLARNLRSPLDPTLIVRDKDGKALQSNGDASGLDSSLRFTPPADGIYRACVRDHLRRGGPTFFYRLEVGVVPGSAGSNEAVPGRRPEDFGVSVPRGRRNATIVQVNGVDTRVGHELTLGKSSDIDGVRPPSITMRSGLQLVPMVFSATAKAPLRAHLIAPTLTASKQLSEQSIRFLHRFPILRVRNNEPYELRAARAMPVAVTQAVPFDVQAATPGVPIVRSGTLALPITVPRDLVGTTKKSPGKAFAGTVTVSALWLPPGVSASRLRLTGTKTSGTITLNANSRASIGEWPIVLRASASIGGVVQTISTDVLTLKVEQPWITGKLPRTRIEQGSEATFEVALEHKHKWLGKVTIELGRIPKGVSYTTPPITDGTSKLPITLRAAKNARRGRQRSIYMRIKIATKNGVITHTVGGGELRVDRPTPAETPKPQSPAKPAGNAP